MENSAKGGTESTTNVEQVEKERVLSYIIEVTNRNEKRLELQNKNVNITYPDDNLCKLESNFKKSTALVRKLRSFTEQQLESVLNEMKGLNLEKYISEIATGLLEAKLKFTDVNAAITLCCKLHEMYPEFSKVLFEMWQKNFSIKKDEKIRNISKLRVDIKLYGGLLLVGIFTQKDAFSLLRNILIALTNNDKDEHANSSVILSFCKHCAEDYAGVIPKKMRELSIKYDIKIPTFNIIDVEKQKCIRLLLVDYYNSLCTHMLNEYEELQIVDKENKKILQTKGEVSADRKEKWDALNNTFQKLHTTVISFSEILDEPVPELKDDKHSTDLNDSILTPLFETDKNPSGSVWEDNESRMFYEEFPDVTHYMPSSKTNNKDGQQTPIKSDEKQDTVIASGDVKKDIPNVTTTKVSSRSSQVTDRKLLKGLSKSDETLPKESSSSSEPKELSSDSNSVIKETSQGPLTKSSQGADENVSKGSVKFKGKGSSGKGDFETFLNHLPKCINKEMIDNAAMEFLIYYNTKNNRRKLIKILFNVPRTRLDLLPFYGRFTAILNSVIPNMAVDLVNLLKNDFKFHIHKKDQINIETKIKVIRFIGELVKFSLFDKKEGLQCLKDLLNDFTHHHIEMACNFLETAGRMLYHDPDTCHSMRVCMEQIMRKKMVTNFDWRYSTMIENAYYYVIPPPENVYEETRKMTLLEKFIWHLLYEYLRADDEVEMYVLLFIRKLNWEDKSIRQFVINCLTKAWKVTYFSIPCLANLLAGLVQFQEFVGTQVVDNVLEDIRYGLESWNIKMNQRRIAVIKYFGELYNYRMIESNDVFRVLYTFITYGVSYDYNSISYLDLPDNTFRLRLVCVLLDTCGQYFSRGFSKERLDCFIIYFKNYYLVKYFNPIWTTQNPFPVEVKYMVHDTLSTLRPNTEIVYDLEQANNAAYELQMKFTEKLKLETEKSTDDELFDTIPEEDESEEVLSDWEQMVESEEDKASDLEKSRNGDEFDSEFADDLEKMISTSMQNRLTEVVKPQQTDISIPYNIRHNLKKNYEQLQRDREVEKDTSSTMNLTVLLRKGNKQHTKNLQLPMECELAKNFKSQEKAARVEMERVKKITLDINDRLEAEDYQNQINSVKNVVSAIFK